MDDKVGKWHDIILRLCAQTACTPNLNNINAHRTVITQM